MCNYRLAGIDMPKTTFILNSISSTHNSTPSYSKHTDTPELFNFQTAEIVLIESPAAILFIQSLNISGSVFDQIKKNKVPKQSVEHYERIGKTNKIQGCYMSLHILHFQQIQTNEFSLRL